MYLMSIFFFFFDVSIVFVYWNVEYLIYIICSVIQELKHSSRIVSVIQCMRINFILARRVGLNWFLILQDKSPFNRFCLTAWLNLNDWCVNSTLYTCISEKRSIPLNYQVQIDFSLILQKSHFPWVLSRWAYQRVLVLSCSPTEFSLRDFCHVLSSTLLESPDCCWVFFL